MDRGKIDGMARRAKWIVLPLAITAIGLAAWASYTCQTRGFWGDVVAFFAGDHCR